jgi:hypothetical protein
MRRIVVLSLLGAVAALAAVFGVLRRSSQHPSPVAAAAEADGGPQTPADSLRLKALGGRTSVTRAQIARAYAQSFAISSTAGTRE